ncbi:SdpI family protein [Vibrio viridaestus]|uniref:SdpI family protein n=1 Tax=Vibrio viridaestus TaxID=2487322 RepID=A0A3N9TJA2_9VIBR|nr:SdpI family protein [Vibrio viridaestus]RQW64379.1 hypothetical protein EES38_07315 [Vibrio viridaestus]
MHNSLIGSENIFLGLIIVVISIPLLRRKIRMNPWYGIRHKASFHSTDNWFLINEFGAKKLISWSYYVIAFGVATLFLPTFGTTTTFFSELAPLILIVPFYQTMLYAKTLRK